MADFARIASGGLFAFQVIGAWDCAASCSTQARVAQHPRVAQQAKSELCGWIGVRVSPMTAAFADSLGMAEPYGAIFDQPEPDSPAAAARIEQGDVLTTINGAPLMQSTDFANIISSMAPGTPVYFDTSRNGEPKQVTVILGSTQCRGGG
jgi:C-terminal processing protease CtpA/Prc